MNPGSTALPTLQICQPGFDVRNCPDWAYLFNGNWPNLSIAFDDTIPTPLPAKVPHNLGFPPLVMGWESFGTYSYGRIPSAMFSVDSNYVYFSNYSSGATSVTIRCFNVDISQEQTYPLPQSAQAKLPYNDQFGIKVLKQTGNRVITSTNLNDFIIHSRAQSPAVLQVATEKGKYFTTNNPGSNFSGPYIVYPLKTSYVPWAFGVVQTSPGLYKFYSTTAMQVINNQLVFPMGGFNAGSLIVLRDPLFYPNITSVVY